MGIPLARPRVVRRQARGRYNGGWRPPRLVVTSVTALHVEGPRKRLIGAHPHIRRRRIGNSRLCQQRSGLKTPSEPRFALAARAVVLRTQNVLGSSRDLPRSTAGFSGAHLLAQQLIEVKAHSQHHANRPSEPPPPPPLSIDHYCEVRTLLA